MPGSTEAKKYCPFASEVALRVNFVASLIKVTVAPGSMAPVLSATVPRRLPALCAKAKPAWARTSTVRATRTIKLLDMSPSLVTRGEVPVQKRRSRRFRA